MTEEGARFKKGMHHEFGHIFLKSRRKREMFYYIDTKLDRLYFQFTHPSGDILYKILKKFTPEEAEVSYGGRLDT